MSEVYYRGVSKSFLEEVGDNGEYLSVHIAHLRNLLQHVHVATTSARPAFEPEATNTDYASRAQVQACSGLLDYYFTEKDFERHINRATERAIVFGEWFLTEVWDPFAGSIVDVVPAEGAEDQEGEPEARPVYSGDIRIETHGPNDVIRDVTKTSFEALQWVIVRRFCNRWDLLAQYPDKRDDIVAAEDAREGRRSDYTLSPLRLQSVAGRQTDDVEIYTFYHERTPALPLGRVVECLRGTVLMDQTMEQAGYAKMPLYRVSAADINEAPFGYTGAFDLLALIDLCNLLYSTVATNQANFGVQSVQCPVGSSVKATKITKGLTLFEYASTGKLEPLQLTQTPAEIFKFIEMVERLLETLSGVNSVARGDPAASLKSGAALALVQAQFIEFTRALQLSYSELNRKVGSGAVELFKRHADSPRLAAIAGRGGKTHLQELAGKDIAMVTRVTVNMGNHLTRTPAGRYNVAELLVQSGLPISAQQLLAVLSTGKLEPLTHGPQASLDLIQAENEEIAMGRAPAVLITDDHALHVMEHAAVGSDLEARKRTDVMQALATHTMDHLQQMASMPPQLAALLRQPVAAPAAPGQTPQPPGAEGAGPPAAEPAGGGAELPEAVARGPAGVAYPTDPLTGEQWTPSPSGA
jgi:hypothetical protein